MKFQRTCLRLWCTPLLLLVTSRAAAADVFVVDIASGPGADFASIQAAIAAASDGDTILIRPGNYTEHPVINGKSLTLIGDGDGVSVTAFSFFPTFGFSPTILVRNLAPGQEVLVRGLNLASGTLVENCDGAVWFDEISVAGYASCYDGGVAGAYVKNSTKVSFTRCSLTGQNGNSIDASVYQGAPGLHAISATVQLFDCEIRGGWGQNGVGFRPATDGGAGALIQASTVTIIGCTIVGGAGGLGAAPVCEATHSDSGAGVNFLGNAGTVISAASTATGGVADLEALCPGLMGPEGPAIAGTGTIVPLAGFARHLQANSPVRGGEVLTFEVGGVEGEIPLLLVSLAHDPIQVSTLNSVLLVGLPVADVFTLAPLPAGGETTLAFPVPNIGASVAGLTYYAQGIFLDGTPAIWLSAGTTVTLLNASF